MAATVWIKKLHIYLGLLNFTALVIFGVVGLSTSFLPLPNERSKPEPAVRFVSYEAPTDLSDRDLADHAFRHLAIPMTSPAPDWSLRRDRDNNLRFRLPTLPRVHDVAVLESESRLQVRTSPVDFWSYLFHMHEVTNAHAHPHGAVTLWGLYIELSIWSIIFMALSGVYLWLTSRPKLRWAQVSLAAGVASFIALWILSR